MVQYRLSRSAQKVNQFSSPWRWRSPSEGVHVNSLKQGHVCRICQVRDFFILLMEEILHHLGCIKPCAYWGKLPTVATAAGFLPSTVWMVSWWMDMLAGDQLMMRLLVVSEKPGHPCKVMAGTWKYPRKGKEKHLYKIQGGISRDISFLGIWLVFGYHGGYPCPWFFRHVQSISISCLSSWWFQTNKQILDPSQIGPFPQKQGWK